MEECLKSLRAAFRTAAIFILLSVAYLITTDLTTGQNVIFSKYEKLRELSVHKGYNDWVAQRYDLSARADGYKSQIVDFVQANGLSIHRERFDSLVQVGIYHPLSDVPNLHDTSIGNFVRALSVNADKQGGVVDFDLASALAGADRLIYRTNNLCGFNLKLDFRYVTRTIERRVNSIGSDFWLYDEIEPPENCNVSTDAVPIDLVVSGKIRYLEEVSIREWLKEAHKISNIDTFLTSPEMRAFGTVPVVRNYSDGFDNLSRLIEEADKSTSGFEFAGFKVEPRFVAMLVPAIVALLILWVALQLNFVRRALSHSNSEDLSMARNFPSPIISVDLFSVSIVAILFCVLPACIMIYLIYWVHADEIVSVFYGSDVPMTAIVSGYIGSILALGFSYAETQRSLRRLESQ